MTAVSGAGRADAADGQRTQGIADRLRSWTWTPGRIGATVYFAVLAGYCLVEGVPIDRIGQAGWILAGIIAVRLGRPLADHVRVLIDWLPLLLALLAYDHTRGFADTLGMPLRLTELPAVDSWLAGGVVPTVWLQSTLYDPNNVPLWEVPISMVYFSHFIVPWALAAVLYVRNRPQWVRYMRRVIVLSYAGLLTYVLLPAAPPWYASDAGVIEYPIDRIAIRGWDVLGLETAGAWLEQAQAGSNVVAALPSLHAAFAMMVTVALWPMVRHQALRVALAIFPVAMGFSLVYGGEHYVSDVVLGWLYVAGAVALARVWERWRSGSTSPAGDVSR